MTPQLKVSIIIPAYNVEKYIERCVESAMNQTLKELEIIIINDGSTDNTRNIIEKMALKDDRIKIINKKNAGLASARNTGILTSNGEYIQHLDGDDWIEKEACKELYEIAKKDKLDIVIYDFYKDFDNGKLLKIDSFKFSEKIVLNSQECLKELNEKNLNVNILAKFIKRTLYIDNNIMHLEGISLGEDLVTTPKLISISTRMKKQNKAYYHYIFNPKSLTNSKFSEKIGELFTCFDELNRFFKEKNIDDFYLKVLKANHLANFFYNTPLQNQEFYNRNFKKFELYLSTVDRTVINQLSKEKKMLYIIFRIIKNTKLKIKLIRILSKLKIKINETSEKN